MDRIEPHSPASRAGSEVDPATLARAQQGDATAVERIASALELAVGELPREQRAAFLLAECHGLTTAEIAQVTDTTRATVKTRLFRARARLKRSLRAIWEEER